MSRRARCGLLLAVGLGLVSCSGKDGTAVPEEPGQADSARPPARFHYDLGPATVDVSRYPREQQKNYELFLTVCGACHTTARPLNSPFTDAVVWRRYVQRMHVKMEGQGILLSDPDQERIIDFLVYDSKVRKIDREAEFLADDENLKKRSEESSAEQ